MIEWIMSFWNSLEWKDIAMYLAPIAGAGFLFWLFMSFIDD